MTTAAKSFEIEWPSLERRLRSYLAGRGVPAEDRDDIIQETGIRLMKMWSEIDWDRSVWNLSATIATRIWYDDLRRPIRHQLVDEIPDIVSTEDPERIVIARLELSRVGSALAKLNPRYRSVLVDDLADVSVPNVRAGTLNVVRLRARRRLSSILGRVLAPIGSLGRRIRIQLDDISRYQARSLDHLNVFSSAGISVIAALIVVATGGAAARSVPSESAQREWVPRFVTEAAVGAGVQGAISRSSASQPPSVRRSPAPRRGTGQADQHQPRGSGSPSELGRKWRQVTNQYHDAVRSYHQAVDNAHRTYEGIRRLVKQHRDAHKDGLGKARKQWQEARDVGLP